MHLKHTCINFGSWCEIKKRMLLSMHCQLQAEVYKTAILSFLPRRWFSCFNMHTCRLVCKYRNPFKKCLKQHKETASMCMVTTILNKLHITTILVDMQIWKTKHPGNFSKISVSLTCYWQNGSKSTNLLSTSCWQAVIGEFWSDMSITHKTDGSFGNVSAGVLLSKVAHQRKRW